MNNLIKTFGVKLTFVLFSTAIVFGGFLFTQTTEAQYESACSEYGVMAYESGGYCKCMSGYVMGEDFMGNSQCVSGDSLCDDKYGYGSDYDSLSGSCECSYGYVWGENIFGERQCITETQACTDQLGIHSRSTYGGNCECSYGYVIDGGQCKDGDMVCKSDHGIYSSYDSLSNKCECDDEYTFDDNYQCIEKQHNVYFKLLDINPEDDKELLIKSDYDYSKYKVRVGIGCLSTTIERYRGKNLVVNLGTDYSVDTFDTVVLQDDSQTCSVVYREKTYDDSFPEPEEEETYYYTPVNTYVAPSYTATPEPVQTPTSETSNFTYDTPLESLTTSDETPENEATTSDQGDMIETPTTTTISAPDEQLTQQSEPEEEVKVGFFRKIINFFKGLF